MSIQLLTNVYFLVYIFNFLSIKAINIITQLKMVKYLNTKDHPVKIICLRFDYYTILYDNIPELPKVCPSLQMSRLFP